MSAGWEQSENFGAKNERFQTAEADEADEAKADEREVEDHQDKDKNARRGR